VFLAASLGDDRHGPQVEFFGHVVSTQREVEQSRVVGDPRDVQVIGPESLDPGLQRALEQGLGLLVATLQTVEVGEVAMLANAKARL
jgi:hypothetical protein